MAVFSLISHQFNRFSIKNHLKNITCSYLYSRNYSIALKNEKNTNFRKSEIWKSFNINQKNLIIINQIRLISNTKSYKQKDLSNSSNRPKRSIPQLMDFPEILWPSILKSIKNWILINFIIRPYFDRDFTLPDFVAGAKQALQIVSTKLAEGELSSLPGLVTQEALNEIKTVISKMSMAERNELCIKKDDIFLTFPYQIGIMFDESNENIQKRWVEITMVFHVMKGLRDMQERGQAPLMNMGTLPEYRDKVSVCNYRFIKEFTQGNESDWTINIINHFKPADYIED